MNSQSVPNLTIGPLRREDIDAVAFDLDGTLVDSAPDIRDALNLSLEEAGLARFDLDTVRAWIGAASVAWFLAACGGGGGSAGVTGGSGGSGTGDSQAGTWPRCSWA